MGEQGTILHSADDGVTWIPQPSPASDDFYGVALANAEVGLAVGRNGQAVLTTNGGGSWVDVSTGLNVFLASVVWLDSHTALVVGEGGTVLDLSVQ